jgi:hypothetical protein
MTEVGVVSLAGGRALLATRRTGRPVPGDGLLHPMILAAIVVLVINDQVLKTVMPGFITGKLSDVAGLLFFPALVVAVLEQASAVAGHRRIAGAGTVATTVLLTGAAFALVKLTAGGALGFGWLLGVGQSLPAIAVAAVVGGPWPAIGAARVVADPTDLVALVALLPALAIGLTRVRAGGS